MPGTELAMLRGISRAGQGDLNAAVNELATATVAAAAPPPAAAPAAPPDYSGDLQKALEGQGLEPEVMEAANNLMAPYMERLAADPDGTIAQMTEDLSASPETARIGLINAMVASIPGDVTARTAAAANLSAQFGVDHGMLGLDAEAVRQAQQTMQERVYAQPGRPLLGVPLRGWKLSGGLAGKWWICSTRPRTGSLTTRSLGSKGWKPQQQQPKRRLRPR